MKLSDYLPDTSWMSREGREPAERLRDGLYARLSPETISAFVAHDRARARAEVMAALQLELRDPVYAGMTVEEGERLCHQVADMAVGLGPLEPLMDDPDVTEVMVNGQESIFYEKEGRLFPSDLRFDDEDQLRAIIERIVAPIGRRVDEQTPMVSARLPGGHRVNVVLPPCAVDGPVLTVRKFRESVYTLAELVSMGSCEERCAQLLSWAVRARRNIAVSGGTGTGKTTLLNALSVEIDPAERIITIEDSAELRFSRHPHVVRLEARASNVEGKGEVTIRDLVTNALRMRPDRIVVGECRGAEALDMLQAMKIRH